MITEKTDVLTDLLKVHDGVNDDVEDDDEEEDDEEDDDEEDDDEEDDDEDNEDNEDDEDKERYFLRSHSSGIICRVVCIPDKQTSSIRSYKSCSKKASLQIEHTDRKRESGRILVPDDFKRHEPGHDNNTPANPANRLQQWDRHIERLVIICKPDVIVRKSIF